MEYRDQFAPFTILAVIRDNGNLRPIHEDLQAFKNAQLFLSKTEGGITDQMEQKLKDEADILKVIKTRMDKMVPKSFDKCVQMFDEEIQLQETFGTTRETDIQTYHQIAEKLGIEDIGAFNRQLINKFQELF